ncbi:hypothetical protein ACFL35_01310 [Candidatus Riflebacteria bacterium]
MIFSKSVRSRSPEPPDQRMSTTQRVIKYWTKKGRLDTVQNYQNGKRHGIERDYNNWTGKFEKKIYWENGCKVREESVNQ